MRRKKASAIIAIILVVAVSAAAMLVLTALSSSIEFKNDMKSLVTDEYGKEVVLTLVLDSAVKQMQEYTASDTELSEFGDCEGILDALNAKYSPGGFFDISPIEFLADDMDVPEDYEKHITKVFDRNAEVDISCYLSEDPEIDYAYANDDLSSSGNSIPLEPFQITVSLSARNTYCERTWEIFDAVLLIDEGQSSYTGRISLAGAEFSVLNTTIK